jgi:rSAM/selenodomain-associated transferase 2
VTPRPLSIVIPALDEARSLARLLPALARDCPGVEIIVVDGGSRDGTAAVAASVPGVSVAASARGRARQMNAGAAAAQGEALLFLHADTVLPPGAAEAVARALEAPEVVGGRFDVRFDSPRRPFRVIAWFMNRRSRLSGIATGDQAIFVRRAAFDALGGYPDIPLMEDIELSRRMRRAGRLACLGLRVTTAARKWEREGVARTVLLMWTLRFLHWAGVPPARLHEWYYGRPAPDGAARAGAGSGDAGGRPGPLPGLEPTAGGG